MTAEVIHTTNAELHTERFWCEHIDPVARAHGMEPPDHLERDQGDMAAHLLKDPDGKLILIVRTDAKEAL